MEMVAASETDLEATKFRITILHKKALVTNIHMIYVVVALKLLKSMKFSSDRLCGLVVSVPGCKSRGPCSIPSATRFFEK
jgi:hypothetical protein